MAKEILKTAYLYSDGHAVELCEKRDNTTGIYIEYCKIIEKKCECRFKSGRIIFFSCEHNGYYDLIDKNTVIDINQKDWINERSGIYADSIEIYSHKTEKSIHYDNLYTSIDNQKTGPSSVYWEKLNNQQTEVWKDIVNLDNWCSFKIVKTISEVK